jgi:hypothetical protein
MAYDEGLAQRVREVMPRDLDVKEKKMFGGLTFMVEGHMSCGIVGDRLMVRLPRDAHDAALAQRHVHPMDFTGRPMRGFVYIDAVGVADDAVLAEWVGRGVDYARQLPPK